MRGLPPAPTGLARPVCVAPPPGRPIGATATMPTYAYGCATCGHRFDQFQRFSEDPLRECPECGAAIRRLIQPVGVVFKGSGWYINDSRPTAKEDGAPAAKADAKTDGKGDAAAPAAEKTDKSEKAEKAEKADKKESGKTATAAEPAKRAKPASVAAD